MADRWMDERDRMWRDRDWRRAEQYGRGERDMGGPDRARGRYGALPGEERSWGGADDHHVPDYGAGRSSPDRSSAQGYSAEERGGYGPGESYGRGSGRGAAYRGGSQSTGWQGGRYGGARNWQDRDYGGVSPAMEQGEYDAERAAERYGQGRGEGGYAGSGHERYEAERERRAEHRRGPFEEGYDSRMSASGDDPWADREPGGDRGERWERGGREAGEFFRRTGERVASWFGGGEGRREEGRSWQEEKRGFRGMGPKGYKRADERISDEVHERLTDDPWVDASNISISVSGGEVTLSGTVENREAKHRAERVVEDISGVQHVQNNLRVDRGNPLTRPASGYGDSVLEHQMRGETGAGESFGSMGASSGHAASTTTGGATLASAKAPGPASTDAGKSR